MNLVKIEKTVQIVLTEQCNLHCSYCYEKNKKHKTISLELLKKILIKEFSKARDERIKALNIYFHGGEICTCFSLIKTICEWLWSKDWGIAYICTGTTNGTLLHGELQHWFYKNREKFVLGLSLDGNQAMHDINRNNSYAKIDLDFFLKTYPAQPVKMTISPNTIDNLSSGIIDILEKGFKLSANLAYGCNWNEDMKYTYAKQLFILIKYLLANPQFSAPLNILNKQFTQYGKFLYLGIPIRPNKHCGGGEGIRCYDVTGSIYPCQIFLPSTEQAIVMPKGEIQKDNIFYSKECIECELSSLCHKCLGYYRVHEHNLIKEPDILCDFRKIEVLYYSYFLYAMLNDKSKYNTTKHMDEVEIALNKIAISKVQQNLKNSHIHKYIQTSQ